MTHLHLLIDTNQNLNRKQLSKYLGINTKAITYTEKIRDINRASFYSTKCIDKTSLGYNLYLAKMNNLI